MPQPQSPASIKQYADRLYDTARGSYVTLEDLTAMIREGEEFAVYDAKTGEDITRSVLTRIVYERKH
jgi:polyhydroxyalkanoate synthesis repressor PhaR